MTGARDTYLGWDELRHFTGCKRPVWTVDTRTEYDAYRRRDRDSTAAHSCPDEECAHGPRYTRTTVRIVCQSCSRAHVISSEDDLDTTQAKHLGYGLPPRRVAGLLLWSGEPLLSYGRLADDEPWDFIVTGPGVTRPVREDLVGEICQTRGKRGAVLYGAVARLSDDGAYGWSPFRWAAAAEGLRSVPAAAKWIASHLTNSSTAKGDR